jgi:hypothetical protein
MLYILLKVVQVYQSWAPSIKKKLSNQKNIYLRKNIYLGKK